MSEQLQLWTPSPFQGSDLLPVATAARKVDTIGRENVRMEDLVLPTLTILQGSSEQVKQGIEGARAGRFYLSGAEEFFDAPIRVLGIAYHFSRSLFPKPDRPEHNGLEECISRDGKTGKTYGECDMCPYSKWDDETNKPPICSETHNLTVLTPLGPAIIRFARTSARGWTRGALSSWNTSANPLWAHPIVITTKVRTDMVNGRPSTTHVMETRWAQRETVPPHVQESARALHEQVSAAQKHGRLSTTDDGEEA